MNRIAGKKLSAMTPKQGQTTEKVLFGLALFLCLSSVLVAVLFQLKKSVQAPQSGGKDQGPNVLLVTVDTLRADHLSVYGYPHIQTRTVDQLAARGILFENTYSTTSWTLPACATLATGRSPRASRVQKMEDQLPDQAVTLARVMKESGRATAAVTSNAFLSKAYGFDQGFDRFINVYENNLRPALSGIYLYDNFYRLVYSLDDAAHVTELAVRQLDDLSHHSFFFWIHYMDPHKPYGGPWPLEIPEYDRDYNGTIHFVYGWKKPVNELRQPLTEEDLRHVKALYDADILRFDGFFSVLLQEMKKRGMLENTIIALTADHGEEFLEHGAFGHGNNLHVEEVRIPLILAGPGIPRGIRSRPRASLLDLPKTLCNVAGFQPPPQFQGRPLVPLSEDEPESSAFSELQFKGRQQFSLRHTGADSNPYCYLNDMRSGEEKLYDVAEDPLEQMDLSGSRPGVTEHAMSLLQNRIHKENLEASAIQKGDPVTLGRDYRHVLQELGYIGD
jgi:arylsulfatase